MPCVQGRILRLRTNGCGVEKQFSAHQGHCARTFGIPLVPADADANSCAEHVPDLEPSIAGAKIIFFLIAGAIGNVAFTIDAHDVAIGVNHRDTVVEMRPITFKEACGDGNIKPLSKFCHRLDGGMLQDGVCQRKMLFLLRFAEIGAGKQFGRQDDLRTQV